MSITLNFSCGGCDAAAPSTTFLSRRRRDPKTLTTAVQSIAPDGWIAFDPYTSCTYCPKCWAEIEGYEPEQGEK